MTLTETIEQKINDMVPQMIEESVSSHTHGGGDSQQLTASSFAQAPQPAVGAPTGGTVIDVEGRAAFDALLSRLQALGFINQ